MTAPVTQSASSGAYVILFAMPAGWTLETLPEPLDPKFTLRTMPALTLAVIRYSGTWSQSRYEERAQQATPKKSAALRPPVQEPAGFRTYATLRRENPSPAKPIPNRAREIGSGTLEPPQPLSPLIDRQDLK